jgi:hypothetical protein
MDFTIGPSPSDQIAVSRYFPKKMDGEEGTGRSTTDDGNGVVVMQAS